MSPTFYFKKAGKKHKDKIKANVSKYRPNNAIYI
jgi:hypothetical protein